MVRRDNPPEPQTEADENDRDDEELEDRLHLLLRLFTKGEANHRVEHGEAGHVEELQDRYLIASAVFSAMVSF